MRELIGTIVLAFLLVALIGLIVSYPVMLLWNYCLVPAVTGLNQIGWLQAWGLLILSGLLIKTSHSSKSK